MASSSMSDLRNWLEGLGLEEYVETFDENKIDREVLTELTEDDLKDLGILLGHRKKLMQAIAALAPTASPASASAGQASRVDEAEGERRHLTVMFCDLVGSTSLSTRLDPEDLREVIESFHTCCESVIKRFNGYIASYMGDGLLEIPVPCSPRRWVSG